jgi:predicted house-cleaning noncanonical NTP pyrophosphatase (MazG superfamily)
MRLIAAIDRLAGAVEFRKTNIGQLRMQRQIRRIAR